MHTIKIEKLKGAFIEDGSNRCGSTTFWRGTGKPFWMCIEMIKYGSLPDEWLIIEPPLPLRWNKVVSKN